MDSDDDSYASSDEEKLLSEDERPARASRAKPQPTTLDLGRILVDPVPTVYSCRTLYEMMHHSELDLDPEYQRDVVWQDSDQCALIDSLLRNYYVPPVILAKRVQEDGGPVWTCIDGKQRLTSIQRFMDGMIPFKDKASRSAYYYKSSGKTGKVLPEPLRRRLENVQLVCVIYNGITLDDEREIFQRVQFGKDLKKDEKWRAKAGKNPVLVKKVLGEIVNCNNGLAALLPWDKARGKDFACVAEAVYRIECLPNTTMKISLTKWLDVEGTIDPTFEAQVLDIFRIFLHIARDPVHIKVFKKHATMFSPVEFIMTAVLIGKYRDRLSLPALVTAIDDMRTDIRALYKDVKNNGYSKKAMYTFINKKVSAPVIPLAQTAGATVLKPAAAKRKRSESPDAPLAQALQKRFRTSLSSSSTATPARAPPEAKTSSAPSTFRLPKLKAPGAAPVLSQSPASTQQATPPPPPATPATPTPAPPTPAPLSSVFQPEEDVKPVIRPMLQFQPTPVQRPAALSALQASAAQARKTFETSSGGLLGQRAPLFFEKTKKKPAPT